MAKRKKIQNRMDELFGLLGVEADDSGVHSPGKAPAQPVLENPAVEPGGDRPNDGAFAEQGSAKKPGRITRSLADPVVIPVRKTANLQPRPETAGRIRTPQMQGWEDYLDAIDRSDAIRISYEPNQEPGNGKDGAVNLLEVPLEIGSQRLGALQLEVDGGQDLDEEQAALVTAVSQQVLLHIENLRLMQQAEQYREEAEQATRRLTHTAWGEYLSSPDAPPRAFVYGGHRVSPLEPSALALDEGNLACELKVRDETIGKLVVAQAQEEADAASALVTEIAGRLSSHIENLRLLDETERSRQQLNKRAEALEMVAKVSTTAASTLDPDVLLQSVVNLTRYSFHMYHAQIFLLNPEADLLELKAASGKIGEGQLSKALIISMNNQRSPVSRAACTHQGVMISDVLAEAGYPHNPALPDVRSELAVPMLFGERLLGVLDVLSDQPQRFGSDDMLTFSTLAAQVAVALRNAELYAEQLVTVERLRDLDQLKSSFLANMSHELRTPLNSILGFTQVIMEELDGPVPEIMHSDLALIEKNGMHLLHLINDVLDMAKIEAGRMNLSIEPVDLAELVEEVLQITQPLARDRGLFQHFEPPVEGRVILNMDHTRIRQVLINLIGNAIKFTEHGGVIIRLYRDEESVRIEICDTGLGIPEEKLETIFEAFSQVDTTTTRKVGGTGLGLPISRRLVELHDGRLWAESTGVAGEGSTFYIEFPRSSG